jgi:hypothetical protein
MKQPGSVAMTHRAIPTRSRYLVLKRETEGARDDGEDATYQAHGDESDGGGGGGELVDFLRDESYVVDCGLAATVHD